jgi:2-desacetyl-2-hydroxyethyl bacteriochlorophyllide A dehydrogenase
VKALWLENRKLIFRDDCPIPKPGKGEALIRVTLAGICSTDLELCEGYYPFTGIPGHEFVGVVVDSQGDTQLNGKRVVGEINVPCGVCSSCRRGHPTHCEQRAVLGIRDLDGAFAEYLILPLSNLHLVPDNVSDDEAVFTEPLAAALEILEQVHILPLDRVLVVGAGRLGQLIAQVLQLTVCDLNIVTRYQYQRDILAKLGIKFIAEEDVRLGKMDLVVEASGSPGGLNLALKAIRPRGTIVLKSTYARTMTINPSPIVVDEITLVGSRCGPFLPALALLANQKVDLDPLISARFGLNHGLDAFKYTSTPGVLKVILGMD